LVCVFVGGGVGVLENFMYIPMFDGLFVLENRYFEYDVFRRARAFPYVVGGK